MKTINRLMCNICSDQLAESRDFYTKLFDFKVDYDGDWFVLLISKDKQLELGIISQTSEIVPDAVRNNPQGFYLTFVVDSADDVIEMAKNEGHEIISEPADTFYGQRRLRLSTQMAQL